MAYTKYSLTPANNNAAPPDGAPEGMLPSAVNDTMRDMMAQIRDCGDGIRGGTYTMTAPVITGGSISGASISATSLTDSGNLTFTGTGNRITGDFSNATVANRAIIQTSTTNGATTVTTIPNGASATAQIQLVNSSSDLVNNAYGLFRVDASAVSVYSAINGTGTYLPLTLYTGGSERLRIDTSGNVGIGTSSAADSSSRLTVSGTSTVLLDASGSLLRFNKTAGTDTGWLSNRSYGWHNGNGLALSTQTADDLKFGTNSTERMRIDSSGNLLVGTTSAGAMITAKTQTAFGSALATLGTTGDTSFQAILVTKFDNNTTTSQNFIQFQVNNGGANCGKITANGANTAAFTSTSDARLKENIVDLPAQLENICALRPVEFDYIESEGGGHQIGFIAQEIQTVYPDVVNEQENGFLSVTGFSKTEARLIKAIQDQQALITNLTNRLTALEAKG